MSTEQNGDFPFGLIELSPRPNPCCCVRTERCPHTH